MIFFVFLVFLFVLFLRVQLVTAGIFTFIALNFVARGVLSVLEVTGSLFLYFLLLFF